MLTPTRRAGGRCAADGGGKGWTILAGKRLETRNLVSYKCGARECPGGWPGRVSSRL